MKKTLLLFFAFCAINGLWAQTPLTEAVDFTATDIEGNQVNLFSILDSNKYVCIDFFYTTCGPCQQTSPKVNESYHSFGCNSGDIIFLSIDTGDTDEECLQYDETFGVEFPTISGVEGGGTAICNTYGIPAYPTVILIAPDHQIVERDIWPIADGAYLTSVIQGHGIALLDCPSVGIYTESENEDLVKLYPNPTSNYFQVAMDAQEGVLLEVYNLMGAKIISTFVSGKNPQVSIADLQQGTYIVKIGDGNQSMKMQRLTVVR